MTVAKVTCYLHSWTLQNLLDRGTDSVEIHDSIYQDKRCNHCTSQYRCLHSDTGECSTDEGLEAKITLLTAENSKHRWSKHDCR